MASRISGSVPVPRSNPHGLNAGTALQVDNLPFAEQAKETCSTRILAEHGSHCLIEASDTCLAIKCHSTLRDDLKNISVFFEPDRTKTTRRQSRLPAVRSLRRNQSGETSSRVIFLLGRIASFRHLMRYARQPGPEKRNDLGPWMNNCSALQQSNDTLRPACRQFRHSQAAEGLRRREFQAWMRNLTHVVDAFRVC